MSSRWARAALPHRICTGLPCRRLGELIAELAGPWAARQESRLRERRGGRDRLRAEGAGPNRELAFADRVIATLVILRFQLPHAALALFYTVDRSTITRAVHEIRPLLAARGFAVPGEPGLRLRTLADVFAHAASQGVELRIDGTEVRVRRPRANKPGRRAFVSGKMKQNTKKAAVVSDEKGRTPVGRSFPARSHARPDGAEDRGHLRPARAVPPGEGQGRCRIPGTGQAVPRLGPSPAAQAEEGRPARGSVRLGGGPQETVLRADPGRARQLRAQAVAAPPALDRTPRALRRNPPGHRRPGLRPHSHAVISRQPTRQASTTQPQSRTTS